MVKSNFNDETSRLFRSFENNFVAFSDDSLINVRIAAELAAVQNRFSPNNRARGRRSRGTQSFQHGFHHGFNPRGNRFLTRRDEDGDAEQ